MRAKFINFQRGNDPKKSLGIGSYRKIRIPIDWKHLKDGTYKVFHEYSAEFDEIEIEYITVELSGDVIERLHDWTDINDSPIKLSSKTPFLSPEGFDNAWSFDYIIREK